MSKTIDPTDVRRKVCIQISKKGYSEEVINEAYDATEEAAEEAGDLNTSFNDARKRRIARVLEYLTANGAQEQQPQDAGVEPVENAEEEGAGDGGTKSQAMRLKAARVIWNPSVVVDVGHICRSKLEEGSSEGKSAKKEVQEPVDILEDAEVGSASAELLRMQLAKKLRNKLFKVYEPAHPTVLQSRQQLMGKKSGSQSPKEGDPGRGGLQGTRPRVQAAGNIGLPRPTEDSDFRGQPQNRIHHSRMSPECRP
eukprot:998650-Prorocentrum_minimum.AAC.3